MNTAVATFPKEAMRLMAAAPHRLLFLVGAGNVLAAMGWWAAWLVAARVGGAMPQPALPAGRMHAVIMQYMVLPSFIFGFPLTVFPRWLGHPALVARHYLPVGAGLLGKVAAFAFVVVQLVAVTRIASELVPDALGWQAVAAVGWIVAFMPWVLRSAWIHLAPRVDGQPG